MFAGNLHRRDLAVRYSAVRAFAAAIVAPHPWRMLSVGTLFWPPYLGELSIKRPFLNLPVDVTFPQTFRKLDCDGDILEV